MKNTKQTINHNPLDFLSIEIRLTRQNHHKLTPREVDEFVEDTLNRFRKSLTELSGLKQDYQSFCEGEHGCMNLSLSRQTPIYGISPSQDGTILQDDGNDLQGSCNPLQSHKTKNRHKYKSVAFQRVV